MTIPLYGFIKSIGPLLLCKCCLLVTFKITALFGTMSWQCPVHGSVSNFELRGGLQPTERDCKQNLYFNSI